MASDVSRRAGAGLGLTLLALVVNLAWAAPALGQVPTIPETRCFDARTGLQEPCEDQNPTGTQSGPTPGSIALGVGVAAVVGAAVAGTVASTRRRRLASFQSAPAQPPPAAQAEQSVPAGVPQPGGQPYLDGQFYAGPAEPDAMPAAPPAAPVPPAGGAGANPPPPAGAVDAQTLRAIAERMLDELEQARQAGRVDQPRYEARRSQILSWVAEAAAGGGAGAAAGAAIGAALGSAGHPVKGPGVAGPPQAAEPRPDPTPRQPADQYFCTHCGARRSATDRFCGGCGADFGASGT